MSRKKNKARKAAKAPSPRSEVRRRIGKAVLWLCGAALFAGGAAAGLKLLEHKVLTPPPAAVKAPMAVKIKLVDLPAWMPASLADHVATSLTPRNTDFNDMGLAEAIRAAAAKNPWVARVNLVHKQYTNDPLVGLVEVQADYRMPIARVLLKDGHNYAYVDAEGYRLADDPNVPGVPAWAVTVTANGKTQRAYYCDKDEAPPGSEICRAQYITIDGVLAPPPPPGQKWEGDDLADGIKLVQMLRTRKYRDQIATVDVRNHNGRVCPNGREPQIRMYALTPEGEKTDIRFGRFPSPEGDYIVTAERRMKYLDEYFDHHGALAGHNDWIDLRYDQLHVSNN